MTPPFAGKYFFETYLGSNNKEEFIRIVHSNGAFYMYADAQLEDIWEALEAYDDWTKPE